MLRNGNLRKFKKIDKPLSNVTKMWRENISKLTKLGRNSGLYNTYKRNQKNYRNIL